MPKRTVNGNSKGPSPSMRLVDGNPNGRMATSQDTAKMLGGANLVRSVEMPERIKVAGDNAMKAWNTVVPVLIEQGLLTVGDLETVTRYCELQEVYSRALSSTLRQGLSQFSSSLDRYTANPDVAVLLSTLRPLLTIEAHFGMTPATRSTIKRIPQSAGKSDWDEFDRS